MAAVANHLRAVVEPRFLRKLDLTRLRFQHALATRPGSTPLRRVTQSTGVEISGHKPYHPGDDLRHIDWNVLSRLDEVVVRRFRAEREAALHVFIDTSASMNTPPEDGKFAFAQALAASLAYIALHRHDPVRVVAVGASLPHGYVASPVIRHLQMLPALIDFLSSLRPAGTTELRRGVGAALQSFRTPGIAVILSDFLSDPADAKSVLGELAARPFTVAALRLLGPSERHPGRGLRRIELIDAESGRRRRISLDDRSRQRYALALEQHLGQLSEVCKRYGALFQTTDPSHGVERCIFEDLSRLGVIG